VDHLALQPADGKHVAVLEQNIELRAAAGHIVRIEHHAEDALHIADVFADRDLCADPLLEIRRRREMIGMHMRFQHRVDGDPLALRKAQNLLRGVGLGFTGCGIEFQHRIDHRAVQARGVPYEIADRMGRFVEEGLNSHLRCI
jgi:hypothetical protein